jgi:hypothetical protein
MTDVITGTTRWSYWSTTSYSLLMFMLVTYSSKVILFATSKGSSTTFGLIYGSSNKMWKDNQGSAHVKITHRCSSAMDPD